MFDNTLPIRPRSQLNKDIIDIPRDKKYNIYVEDKHTEGIYKTFFSKLLGIPRKDLEIYCLGGKSSVLQKYLSPDSRIPGKKRYLLDKDFDNLYPLYIQKKRLNGETYISLKNKDKIIFLEKYSIENYFFKKNLILDVIDTFSPPNDENKILTNYDECLEIHFEYLYKRLRVVNTYFFINEMYGLGQEFKYPDIFDYKKKRIKPKKYFKNIEKNFEKKFPMLDFKDLKKRCYLLMTDDEIRGHTFLDFLFERIKHDFSKGSGKYQINTNINTFFYNCIKLCDYNNKSEFEFIKSRM